MSVTDEQILLTDMLGKQRRDPIVAGLQALHRERVAAWDTTAAIAFSKGEKPLSRELFSTDEVAELLRIIGAAPSS